MKRLVPVLVVVILLLAFQMEPADGKPAERKQQPRGQGMKITINIYFKQMENQNWMIRRSYELADDESSVRCCFESV